jgi:catechol-2,3-dioxygenase
MSIAAATRMGAVHLSVADLSRSLEYYEAVSARVTPQRAETFKLSAHQTRGWCSGRTGMLQRAPAP